MPVMQNLNKLNYAQVLKKFHVIFLRLLPIDNPKMEIFKTCDLTARSAVEKQTAVCVSRTGKPNQIFIQKSVIERMAAQISRLNSVAFLRAGKKH